MALSVSGGAIFTLTGTGNAYSGGTSIGDTSALKIGDGATSPGSLPGNVVINSTTPGALTFNTPTGMSLTCSGNISGSGSGGLTKSGGGLAILSGSNTYSGATTVSGGTLKVANAAGSATGSGPVTVDAGATLSGPGVIGGPLEIAGELGPGDSTEILTVNNQVTFEPGSDVQRQSVRHNGRQRLRPVDDHRARVAGQFAECDLWDLHAHRPRYSVPHQQHRRGLTSGKFQYADKSLLGTFDGFNWYITYEANDAATPSLTGGNDVAIYSVPEPAACPAGRRRGGDRFGRLEKEKG